MTDSLVLCYHAVSEDFPAALSVTPAAFAAQVETLKRRGYRGVTFAAAASGAAGGKHVAITFDDAYRSVLELAAPILERLEWPATVFAPSDWIGSGRPVRWPGVEQWHGGPHEEELEPMSWEQLAALADAGWEIGSHTCTHPHLTGLADPALHAELAASRAACAEQLGGPCDSIAYPYGDVDARVIGAAARCGYRFGAALSRDLRARGPLAVPRVGVYHRDSPRRFALKVSRVGRRARSSAAWATATGARGLRRG